MVKFLSVRVTVSTVDQNGNLQQRTYKIDPKSFHRSVKHGDDDCHLLLSGRYDADRIKRLSGI